MNSKIKSVSVFFLMMITSSILSGCAGHQVRSKSSIVDYLYANEAGTTVTPSIPTLNVPLNVGIAFVPESTRRTGGSYWWLDGKMGSALAEADKSNLLSKVASHFKQQKFVSDIVVIPSTYLTPGGGFDNLEQLKTIYGIDVIALVSYDQVQFTDEGLLSLTYWTLVGAYVVSGEKNDTTTMLDTAVYDISSKKMLFRAPGTSNVKGRATPVNLSEELRNDSLTSFDDAADKMIVNLSTQLNVFREKMKDNSSKVNVKYREGYSGGGGAVNLYQLSVISILASLWAVSRSSNRS
jgi:rhombotail lipoprotein